MTREKLLPKLILSSLPALGVTGEEHDPIVQVKFFYPDFSWTWYAIEFDGDDLFFGLRRWLRERARHFWLSELMENRGKFGMEIERDLYFSPCPLSTLK